MRETGAVRMIARKQKSCRFEDPFGVPNWSLTNWFSDLQISIFCERDSDSESGLLLQTFETFGIF